jgi:hypothetical protein
MNAARMARHIKQLFRGTTMKPIQSQSISRGFTPAKSALLAAAVAACFPFAAVTARADELSDMKAENQMLMKRLSEMDKRLSELEAAKSAPDAAHAKPAAVPAALKTDQNGSPLDTSVNSVMLYGSADTVLRMYGIVEATISRAEHQTANGGAASGFQTAWFSGNRLGFDVEHALKFGDDIGLSNLKVISKLESEFELPTGNMDTANVFFNRDAWVGFYSDD